MSRFLRLSVNADRSDFFTPSQTIAPEFVFMGLLVAEVRIERFTLPKRLWPSQVGQSFPSFSA